jgi:nitrite reductase/ring-hydroxylating ferredoxin subunit
MTQEPAPQGERPEQSPAHLNTRRGVLLGVGLAGAAGLVAACGGSDEDSGTASSGGTASSSQGTDGGALAQTSAIPVGGGMIFKDQKVVVTQPQQGQFKAFDTTCPHRGCACTSVSGGTIDCPCHGSKFSINDGSVTAGPSKKGLTAKQINVAGGQITLA